MLVLTRNPGDARVLVIGEQVVTVVIDRLGGNRVRFLVDAPESVGVEKGARVVEVQT